MKSGLISINKPFTGNILDGIKKIEWRKSALPKILFFIYETKNKGGCGKVVGEMRITANRRINLPGDTLRKGFIESGCVPYSDLKRYAGESGILWANIIGEVKRYDKPKELSEFKKPCPYTDGTYCIENKCEYYGDWTGVCRCWVERPPQSWCYVEVER